MEMQVGLPGMLKIPHGAVLSVGNFDGLHRGHAEILRRCRDLRQQTRATLAVVTFEPHPLTVLRPESAPPRLTPIDLKRSLLKEAGVDFLVELQPNRDVLEISAERFWELLRDQVKPSHLVEGWSFNFGKNRAGTIERLKEWTQHGGIELHVVDAVQTALLDLTVVPTSSSIIRWLLAHGRVRDAAICLDRPYALVGTVQPGQQRGRTIGIPTANLKPEQQMIPADGVYASRVTLGGKSYVAALSIGTLPTFDTPRFQIEAHLLDFPGGDLYGQAMQIELLDWIRDQRKFPSIDALKTQIARDIEEIRVRAGCFSTRAIATI